MAVSGATDRQLISSSLMASLVGFWPAGVLKNPSL